MHLVQLGARTFEGQMWHELNLKRFLQVAGVLPSSYGPGRITTDGAGWVFRPGPSEGGCLTLGGEYGAPT